MSACAAFSAAPPYIPECRSRSPVRRVTWKYAIPRVARLNAGTSRRIMPLSKMIAASAPRSSASRNSTIEWPPVSSSPSQQKRTLTGSSPGGASSRAAASSM